MSFLYAEALLLLIPAALWWWRIVRIPDQKGRAAFRDGYVLRALVPLLLILALAGPCIVIPRQGSDVILVVDRSASLPSGTAATLAKTAELLAHERGPGDRLGIVSFGERAAVEMPPDETSVPGEFIRSVGFEASDLDGALRLASGLIARDRPGRIYLLSDGEATGSSPLRAAREAAARGIPIDTRHFPRLDREDVAVEEIRLPGLILPGEAFPFSAFVVTSKATTIRYRLFRDDTELMSREARLVPGRNRLLFHDRLDQVGIHSYRLEIGSSGGNDRIPENDSGRGVCEVLGRRAILVVNADGEESSLSQALKQGQREVVTITPEAFRSSLDWLARFGLVIFDGVPATAFSRDSLRTLARHVEDVGAGFLLFGGKRSFGLGGYTASPLDPVLPVHFELDEKHRKLRLALVIALDRSGSMRSIVPSGETKMTLANRGTLEAIRLLGKKDEIAVLVVDTRAHVVHPLTAKGKSEGLVRKVATIESAGGGIFVDSAIAAAAEQLERTDSKAKHILLFSDAADSERPGEYEAQMAALRARGITLSVIALGTRADKDAGLLQELARLGEGEAHFTDDASTLPQLFGQETLARSGSSFIKGRTRPLVLPTLGRIVETRAELPAIEGYNLSYLREGATSAISSGDSYKAPLLGFWHRGLGRVASFATPSSGPVVPEFDTWEDYASFFGSLAEWLIGAVPPPAATARLERKGHEVIVTLDLDPEDAETLLAETPELIVSPDHGDAQTLRLPMRHATEFSLQASFRIDRGSTLHSRVRLKDRTQRLAPVTLPYSPEFEPRLGLTAGADTLDAIARITRGRERLSVDGLFDTDAPARRLWPLAPALILAALILSLSEIAIRRLGLQRGGSLRIERSARPAKPKAAPEPKAKSDATSAPAPRSQAPSEDPLSALGRAKRRADRRLRKD